MHVTVWNSDAHNILTLHLCGVRKIRKKHVISGILYIKNIQVSDVCRWISDMLVDHGFRSDGRIVEPRAEEIKPIYKKKL